MTSKNEWIENLDNNIKVVVSKGHCFNTDTVLLANFSMPKRHEGMSVDLGTGCGGIPFFWISKGYCGKIFAVEVQADAHELMKKSVALNGLDTQVKAINDDLRRADLVLKKGIFDLVVCNPPYKEGHAGIKNKDIKRTVARHETQCTILDVIKTSKSLLKFSGRLCMCNRVERLVDVLTQMRNENIEPKKIQFVHYKKEKPAKLFLVEGKKGASQGLTILNDIVINP